MDGASTTGKQTHNRLNPVKLSRAFGKITESSDPVLDICAAFKTRRILRVRDKTIIRDHLGVYIMLLPPSDGNRDRRERYNLCERTPNRFRRFGKRTKHTQSWCDIIILLRP